ncbi:MAG: DUF2892 domain-containing protein [Myxococcota bacterium]
MKCNEGTLDRALRIAVGAGLLVLAALGHWWGWLGLLQLSTGLGGYCVLYEPFGIDTTQLHPLKVPWAKDKSTC